MLLRDADIVLYLPCGMATCLSMLKVFYWLEEHDSYIWPHCSQLVSNLRTSSPSRKCTGGVIAQSQTSNQPSNTNHMSINDQPAVTLQTFDEVCQLNLPTLRFIPSEVKTCLRWFLSDSPYCQMHPSFCSTGRIALI